MERKHACRRWHLANIVRSGAALRGIGRSAAFGVLALGLAGCALTVRTVGNGTGNVTSDNATINCGSSGTDCGEVTLRPANYTLQAAASNGAIFTGWGGACSGTGTCSVTTDVGKTVFAHFQTPLAVGAYHACAIRLGAIFCWGRSSDGQLGRGPTPGPGQVPSSVLGMRLSALALATGGFHTCAILGDGSVNCWGLGSDGQLGNGVSGGGIRAFAPVAVTGIGSDRPVALAAGGYHTCALLTSGRVQCWGLNKNGQAGSGSPNAPAQVTTATLVVGINNAIAVTAGAFHSCALLAGNTVRCWGRNDSDELGAVSPDTAVPVTASEGRTSVTTLNDLAAVAAGVGVGALGGAQLGGYHTCALKSDGTAVCWGFYRGGVLGNGTVFNDFDTVVNFSPNATPVQALSGSARAIAAGGYHTCVLLISGVIQCWGNGADGQIGNNANSATGSPTTTSLPGPRLGVGLAAGGFQTCALLASPLATTNEVWCWGNNGDGQLGDGTFNNRWTPVKVSVP